MKTKETEEAMAEMGGKLCELIGWRKTIGQLYVLLYLAEHPLSLDDVAERINMSKSSVWVILQKLQRLRAVNKVWFKDKRKDHFVAERNLDLVISEGVIPELMSKVGFAGNYMDQVARLSNNSIASEAEKDQPDLNSNLISEINKILEKAQIFLNLISQMQTK